MPDTPAIPVDDALQRRFERMVDRSGSHHLWLGTTNPSRGTGRIKVAGKQATAHRIAWELAHGPLPDAARVLTCPDVPACVRIEHLSLADAGVVEPVRKPRSMRGTGSKRQIRPGVWKLEVTAGVHDDGSARREFKTVQAGSSDEAAEELARFVVEVRGAPVATSKDIRRTTVDDALETFLVEHLAGEKGREKKTVDDYRRLHEKWFSPHIGSKLVRHVEPSMIDAIFGRMRKAGLSRSRMNQAKSLYGRAFGSFRSA